MSATAAQLQALKVADPWASKAMEQASQVAGIDVPDYWLTFAAGSWPNWSYLPAVTQPIAVALIAALEFRLSLPDGGMGGGEVSSESRPGGSRAFAPGSPPPGFPASWYKHGNGLRVIGMFSANTLPIPTG